MNRFRICIFLVFACFSTLFAQDNELQLARQFAAGAPRVHAATKALRAFGLWRGRKRAMEAWYELSMPLFDMEDAQAALHGAADAVAAGCGWTLRSDFVPRCATYDGNRGANRARGAMQPGADPHTARWHAACADRLGAGARYQRGGDTIDSVRALQNTPP